MSEDLQNVAVGETLANGGVVTAQEKVLDSNGNEATLTSVEFPSNENMLSEEDINDIATSIHAIFDEPRLAKVLVNKLFSCKQFHEAMVPLVGGMIQRIIQMHDAVANNNIVVDFKASVSSDSSGDELKVEFTKTSNGSVEFQRISVGDKVWIGEEEISRNLTPAALDAIRVSTFNLSLEFTDVTVVYGKLYAKEHTATTAKEITDLADSVEDLQPELEMASDK